MPFFLFSRLFKPRGVSLEQERRQTVQTVEHLLKEDRQHRNGLDEAQRRLHELAKDLGDGLVMEAVRRAISITDHGLAEDREWRRWLHRFTVFTSSSKTPLNWIEVVVDRLHDLANKRSAVIDAETRRYWRIIELFENTAMIAAINDVEHRRAALARLAFFDIEAAELLKKTWVLSDASSRMRAVENRRIVWRRVKTYQSVADLHVDVEFRKRKVHELMAAIRSSTGVPRGGFWDVENLQKRIDVLVGTFLRKS